MHWTTSLWPARENNKAESGLDDRRRFSFSTASTSIECTAWDDDGDGDVGIGMNVNATFDVAWDDVPNGTVGDAETSGVGGISFVDTHSCFVSAANLRQAIAERDWE